MRNESLNALGATEADSVPESPELTIQRRHSSDDFRVSLGESCTSSARSSTEEKQRWDPYRPQSYTVYDRNPFMHKKTCRSGHQYVKNLAASPQVEQNSDATRTEASAPTAHNVVSLSSLFTTSAPKAVQAATTSSKSDTVRLPEVRSGRRQSSFDEAPIEDLASRQGNLGKAVSIAACGLFQLPVSSALTTTNQPSAGQGKLVEEPIEDLASRKENLGKAVSIAASGLFQLPVSNAATSTNQPSAAAAPSAPTTNELSARQGKLVEAVAINRSSLYQIQPGRSVGVKRTSSELKGLSEVEGERDSNVSRRFCKHMNLTAQLAVS